VKRTFAGAVLVGALVGYALLSGGCGSTSRRTRPTIRRGPTTSEVRALGESTTPVTVTVLRNSNVVLQREVAANESFARVLSLQGSGEFTLVVSTSGDSTSVDVDRPTQYQSCSGDINLQFSVESEQIYLSTDEEPGRCVEA
jgi:hypothetical protein